MKTGSRQGRRKDKNVNKEDNWGKIENMGEKMDDNCRCLQTHVDRENELNDVYRCVSVCDGWMIDGCVQDEYGSPDTMMKLKSFTQKSGSNTCRKSADTMPTTIGTQAGWARRHGLNAVLLFLRMSKHWFAIENTGQPHGCRHMSCASECSVLQELTADDRSSIDCSWSGVLAGKHRLVSHKLAKRRFLRRNFSSLTVHSTINATDFAWTPTDGLG